MFQLDDSLKRDLHQFDVDVRSTSNEVNIRLTDPLTHDFVGHSRLILEPDKKQVAIESMNVDPDYQGLGIGKVLTRHIVESAQANDYDKVALWAEHDGSVFWPKVGFVPEQDTQRGTSINGAVDNDQTYLGWNQTHTLIGYNLDYLAEDKVYPPEVIDQAKQDISKTDPKSLWTLFNHKEHPNLAADALSGTKMNMVMSLKDPEQMGRWQAQTQDVHLNVDKLSHLRQEHQIMAEPTEQKQEQTQAQEQKPEQTQEQVNERGFGAALWMTQKLGQEQENGDKTLEAGPYTCTLNEENKTFQIENNETGKTVLDVKDGQVNGEMSPKEADKFEAAQMNAAQGLQKESSRELVASNAPER